jgi:multiple sugar transport system permease protein
MTLVKEAPVRPAGKRSAAPAAGRRGRRRENLAGYLFMSPWIAGFLLLTAGPMIASLYYAFTSYNLFTPPQWVGLDNFTTMFQDPRWQKSVEVTLKYVVVATPLKLLLALGVALLLAQKRRGQGLYRAAFYMPSLIAMSVGIAIVWKALFAGGGPQDQFMSWFGWEGGGFIGNPSVSILMLVLLSVWTFGAPMVIFMAGLLQVPGELHEAAEVDGAGKWHRFVHITIPMLSPVIFFNVLLETINSFQAFTPAFVISGGTGGPADSTLFYTLYLYQRAFVHLDMGLASAMAWLLLIAIALLTAFVFWTARYWVFYGDR